MKEKIVNEIIQFIKLEVVNSEDLVIEKDDNIISKGYIDSMGIIRMVSFIQRRYDIKEIKHKDMILDNFKTVEKIAELILSYI